LQKFLLIGFLSVILPAQAQQIFGLTYDISLPAMKTRDLIQRVSIIGFGLDARQMTHRNVSFGVTFHWNSFKDDHLENIDTGEGTFIAIDDRSMESFPLLLNVHYYFFEQYASFRPFLGANAGTFFIIQRRSVDGVRRVDKKFHLGLATDMGFMLEFMREIHLMLTIRFNYALKAGGIPAQSYWSVIFGFVSVSLW